MAGDASDPSKPLPNTRHERFAQAVASGKTATAAYVAAGYKPNDGNAATLKGNQRISARIAHLQSLAASRVVTDRAWVLEKLRANAEAAMEDGDHGPANRALELLGKEIAGMFVDHRRVILELEQELEAFVVALRDKLDPASYDVILREAASARAAATEKHKTGLLS